MPKSDTPLGSFGPGADVTGGSRFAAPAGAGGSSSLRGRNLLKDKYIKYIHPHYFLQTLYAFLYVSLCILYVHFMHAT